MSGSPSLLIVGERRRRGRPVGSKAPEPGSSLSAWVPVSLHDKAIEVAKQNDLSLSKLICEALKMAIAVKTRQ